MSERPNGKKAAYLVRCNSRMQTVLTCIRHLAVAARQILYFCIFSLKLVAHTSPENCFPFVRLTAATAQKRVEIIGCLRWQCACFFASALVAAAIDYSNARAISGGRIFRIRLVRFPKRGRNNANSHARRRNALKGFVHTFLFARLRPLFGRACARIVFFLLLSVFVVPDSLQCAFDANAFSGNNKKAKPENFNYKCAPLHRRRRRFVFWRPAEARCVRTSSAAAPDDRHSSSGALPKEIRSLGEHNGPRRPLNRHSPRSAARIVAS